MINSAAFVSKTYRLLFIVVCFLFIIPISILSQSQSQSQSQYAFNYQGLARDAQGDPISNRNISVRISILKGLDSGEMMFQEVHHINTSDRGLFNLAVGMGENEMGHLFDIEWGNDIYFVKTELDPNGGTNYTDMGAAQLYSVPYAIHALNAESAESGGSDNQQLILSGTVLGISNANSIDLSVLQDGNQDADADPMNELQQLVLTGSVLGISNGNSIDLSSVQDGVDDADADPTNEIQSLNYQNNQLSISNGNTVNIPMTINTDEQILSLSGSTLDISNGNSIDLSVIQDGVDDADSDPTNEYQSLNILNNQLSISNGNTVMLPADQNTDEQVLSFDGTYLDISNGNSVDLSSLINDLDSLPNNELQALSLSGNTLSLSRANSVVLPSGGSNFWKNSGSGINYAGDFFKNENSEGSIFLSGSIGLEHKDNFGNLTSYLGRYGSVGFLQLYNFNDLSVDIASNFDGSGTFATFLAGGDKLTEIDEYKNGGRITLFYKNDKKVVSDTYDDAGSFSLYGQNGRLNVGLDWLNNLKNHGFIGVYDDTGEIRSGLYSTPDRAANMWVDGPSERSNVDITYLDNNHDHGFVSVNNISGNTRAAVYVDEFGYGRVYADFYDSLVDDHPTKSGKKVVYSMLQGPESAAYLRGTGTMEEGIGTITFPGHFSNLIDEESMTVMITPLSSSSKGIAVTKKTKTGFEVRELLDGNGTYDFDWEVKGVRISKGINMKNRTESLPKNIVEGVPLIRDHKMQD